MRELHFVSHAQGCEARTVKLQDSCQKNVAPTSHYQSGSLSLIHKPQMLHEINQIFELIMVKNFNPPPREARKEVANLTETKNPLLYVFDRF